MPIRWLPKQRPGKAISARMLAGTTEESLRAGAMSGPGISNGPFGIVAKLQEFLGIMLVKTPIGGIPALSGTTPGQADCVKLTWDGTALNTGTVPVRVYNPWAFAAGGNKTAIAFKFASSYWLLTWSC